MVSAALSRLDSHQSTDINNALGRLKETWIKRGALMGKIIFNAIRQEAEGMVAHGEIAGISVGFAVHAWEIENPMDVLSIETRISFVGMKTCRSRRSIGTCMKGRLCRSRPTV
jgi:hypothetical protein